jgi:hypothetical protein
MFFESNNSADPGVTDVLFSLKINAVCVCDLLPAWIALNCIFFSDTLIFVCYFCISYGAGSVWVLYFEKHLKSGSAPIGTGTNYTNYNTGTASMPILCIYTRVKFATALPDPDPEDPKTSFHCSPLIFFVFLFYLPDPAPEEPSQTSPRKKQSGVFFIFLFQYLTSVVVYRRKIYSSTMAPPQLSCSTFLCSVYLS